MSNNEQASYDVIIAGGGLSGTLAALSLSQLCRPNGQKLRIAIIEANAIGAEQLISFDDRVLALSHSSACYLQQLGVWQRLTDIAQPIEHIHVSDRSYYGKARLTATDHDVAALGYVIDMKRLGRAIYQSLAQANESGQNDNIHWFTPDIIEKIDWHKKHVSVNLDSGKKITAKLLLGCDGAQSQCRRFAGISVQSKQYQQSALIANVATAKAHKNLAYERFTEFGPIAMLPLPASDSYSHRCSLVWTLPPEEATLMAQLPDSEFNQALEQHFGHWLGEITHAGQRTVFPLALVQANEQIYHRMVLVGNASHTIHPIAGQGFNLGLRDVESFAHQLAQQLANNVDIGELAGLMAYAQARKVDHQQVIELTDTLVTLFSNQLPPLALGRTIGLKVLNYLSPLKNAFAQKTMGY